MKNKKRILELKNVNSELKKQIKEILVKISNLLKKQKKNKDNLNISTSPKKTYFSDYDYLNNNLILSELPIDQQISIYQDSITTLQKKISKIEEYNKLIALNNNVDLFDINQKKNEIKIKKEKLYNIQKENNTLLKVYKNNKKVYDSFEINKGIKYFISEIKKEIQDSKEDLKKKKNELRESELEIREMGKNIIILENNIKIIKDNIEFKKLNEKKALNHTQKSEQINEVKKLNKKSEEMEKTIGVKNEIYIKALNIQELKINNLINVINLLNKEYEKYYMNERFKRIKSMEKIKILKLKNYNKCLPLINNEKIKNQQRPHSTNPFKRKINLKNKVLKTNNSNSIILPRINVLNGKEKHYL